MSIGLASSTDQVLQRRMRSFQRTVLGRARRGHLPDWTMPFRLRLSNRAFADQLRRDAIGQDLTYLGWPLGKKLHDQLLAQKKT